MRFVWPVLTFLGAGVVAVIMGAQYIGPMLLITPAVVLGYAAFASSASYLATVTAIGAGLAVTWPWMTMLFRVMPGPMYALLDISYEVGKTQQELRNANTPSMETSHRLGSACFSGIGVGILLLVAGLLLSASQGTDAARRQMILRGAAVVVTGAGIAALFSPSTSFGFGLLIAAIPGALMIWKSQQDTRATLRVLRETW